MNSFATQGLPLPGLPLPPATLQTPTPGTDTGLLSGEQFLQMLLGLGGFSAEATAQMPPVAIDAGETGAKTKADADTADEATATDAGAGAVLALLPIAAFVASAVKPGAEVSPPAASTGEEVAQTSQVVAAAPAAPAAKLAPVQGTSGTDALKQLVSSAESAVANPALNDPARAPVAAAVVEAVASASASQGDRPAAPSSLASVQSLAASVGTTVGASLGTGAAFVATSPAAPVPVPAQQQVYAPVHSPRWSEEVGQRIAMMAVSGTHSGSLSLVPEQMGPIEVRIHMNQDTANVWFGATQADTRAAIQDALPRLREMFAATGLSLGEAQVSQQMSQRQNDAPPAARSGYAMESEGPITAAQSVQRVGLGLLDTYA